MNDDFLHQHRQAPPEQFGKALYQQLSSDELIIPPRAAPRPQRSRWLRLVAAVLIVAAAGIVTLQSLNRPAATQLAQIETGLLLDDLPPITLDNVDHLQTVAELGTGRASGIAWSPDGETLAVGTPRGIALYEGGLDTTPRLLRTSSGGSYTRPLAFSPDGTRIAVLETDAVRIWDVASGVETTPLETDGADFTYGSLAFSPDGRWIAAGGGTYKPTHLDFYVWNARTGERYAARSADGDQVRALAFSPDGNTLAALTRTGIYLYNPELTLRPALMQRSELDSTGLAFSPDGSTLAVGGANAVAL